jgi:Holliday junction resolvase RusA-like endonuclease
MNIVVSGNPIPKARPRVVDGHAYTPKRTLEWESNISKAWQYKYNNVFMFASDLCITLRFYRDTKIRADYDNLAKAATDALNGVAYRDDSQIVEAHIFKGYDEDNPRVEIEIDRVKGEMR